jgi:hypothetical protein
VGQSTPCVCISALNLDDVLGALNLDTSTYSHLDLGLICTSRFDMHLEVAKFEDAYLKFTQLADILNIGMEF